MQSELHKRLNHLIQYSSGLIFVKSEPEFSVSSCIDALLSEQNENDEVAVLTAKPSMMLDDFRQQLTQQLSSKLTPNSGNLPLAKLLAPSIGQHETGQPQALLICISKGEHLSTSMLDDLQQLIVALQRGSERQVNVLVFAQSQWINKTYQALRSDPSNNVIVVDSGAAVELATNVSGSELEQLIANKRQAFAQRIEQRNHVPPTESPSVMQRPWFIPIIGALFLSLFGGILLSQYPELISSSTDSNQTTVENQSNKVLSDADNPASPNANQKEEIQTLAPSIKTSKGENSSSEQARDADATDNVLLAEKSPLAKEKIDSSVDAENAEQKPQALISSAANEVIQSRGDALVTNWQNESDRIDAAKQKQNTQIEAEDIAQTNVAPANSNVQIGVVAKPVAADVPPIREAPSTTSLPDPYAFDEATILALPNEGYVLQIIGFSVRDAIQKYLQNNDIQQHVWVYQTKRYNKDWYVLLYNKHYPSLPAALRAVTSLPKGMREATPFPKALQKVHQEINSAN
ncbi:SPOR domain-containing protein [Paraglaciecola sp. 20A4]|uniref:SPOR domain-containing protein n=1 Tax=Paraglaciecola sp. 20A4 TaxID=2687288 RepID=UPI00140D6EA7|nr:SPOR domain-containing protein [Paraglaciecola sp. 20A4]